MLVNIKKSNSDSENKIKQNESEKENTTSLITQTRTIDLPSFVFHEDIKDLIWYADGTEKNIDAKSFVKSINKNGIKINIVFQGMLEPSMIFMKEIISAPDYISQVENPPYYPTYDSLSSEQKYVYLSFLTNPYNPNVNIGYVFILYYGLERHLLCGNWEKALQVILKLRDVHNNKSFQSYSAYAIILTAILKEKGEFAINFLNSLDKDFEIKNFPVELYLLCAVSFNFSLKAKQLMLYADWFGFSNKNYIKRFPEIFEHELNEITNKKYGTEEIKLQNFITLDEIKEMPLHDIKVFANTSLQDVKVGIPFITENEKVKNLFYELLSETHNAVKQIINEKRKSGELKENQPQTNTNKKQISSAEYKKRLLNAEKQIPLPAAYREIATSLRGLIKTDKENCKTYISKLYDYAVKESFKLDYSELCQCPGFNIIETIPKTIINTLDYSYTEMGYEKLDLLNKTDIKKIVGIMGEPKNHSTLFEKYYDLWLKYERKYRQNNPF